MSLFCHVMVGERFNPEWDSEIPKGPITTKFHGTMNIVETSVLKCLVGRIALDIGANLVTKLTVTVIPTLDRYSKHTVILTGDAYYVPNLEEWFAEQAETEKLLKQDDQL